MLSSVPKPSTLAFPQILVGDKVLALSSDEQTGFLVGRPSGETSSTELLDPGRWILGVEEEGTKKQPLYIRKLPSFP